MIESRAGAKTPKLDQLKTDIVLGLQELQDQVAKHGRLWNFAYESRLRWERDSDGYGYQIEWSPIDGKIRRSRTGPMSCSGRSMQGR